MSSNKEEILLDQQRLSIGNLLNGAAIERCDDELRRVLENCLDPNAGKVARTITLRITIKPEDDRTRADITVSCESKLSPPSSVQSLIYLGKDRGEAVAYEYNPEQLKLNLAKKTPVVGLATNKDEEQ